MEALPALSLLSVAAAMEMLRRVWTGTLKRTPGLAFAVLLMIAASVIAAQTWGAGRAITWIAICSSLLAAVLVLFHRTSKPRKELKARSLGKSRSEWPDWPVRWLIAVPLAGLASIAAAALAAATLPFASGTRVMIALMVLTFLWPLLAAWAFGTAIKNRAAGLIAAVLIVSTALAAGAFFL